MKKTYLSILALLVFFSLFSCSNNKNLENENEVDKIDSIELKNSKEESILRLENYYDELLNRNYEYSMVFIKNELDYGISLLKSEKDINKIKNIEESTKELMNNLILSDDELAELKKNYWDDSTYSYEYISQYVSNPEELYPNIEDIIPTKYFLGRFNDKFIAIPIMSYGTCEIIIPEYHVNKRYVVYGYVFYYFTGNILIKQGDNSYFLEDAEEKNILTKEEVEIISRRYRAAFIKNYF